MAFPSPFLWPSDSVWPSGFTPDVEPPPPPSFGGQERLTLDDIELNDGDPWVVMREAEIEWTPPRKKLNWVGGPLADGSALPGSEDHYENAELVLTVGLSTQQTKDDALRELHALTQKLNQARRTPGGLPLVWQPSGSAGALTYYVVQAEYEEFNIHRDEGWFTNAPTFRLHLYLRPFGYGAEQQVLLGFSDEFVHDSLVAGPWRFDAGQAEISHGTGTLECSGTTTPKRLYLPYQTEDVEAALRVFIGAGFGLGGLRLKRTGGFTHLAVVVDEANDKLEIRKYVGGTATVLQSVDFPASGSDYYWLVGTISDNTVFAGVYEDGMVDPNTPLVSVTHDLTATSDDDDFGLGIRGQVGISLNPSTATAAVVDQFRVTGMENVTTAEPLATVELAEVKGDVEAEARQSITDTSAQERNHYEWGLESDQYDTALTTPTLLDSDGMVTTGLSSSKQPGGGFAGFDPVAQAGTNTTVVQSSSALAGATPVTICSTGPLRHIGPYKVKARVMALSALQVESGMRVRFAWRVGEGSYTTNDFDNLPLINTWYEVDLGQINIVDTGLVNQTWEGRLQAYNTAVNGLVLFVDYLMFIPLQRWGAARNPIRPVVADTFSALDHFGQTTTPPELVGKALEIGGTWAAGDGTLAGDFVNTTTHLLARTTSADSSLNTGRKDLAGSTSYGAIVVQGDVYTLGPSVDDTDANRHGVFARYVYKGSGGTTTASNYSWIAAVRTNVKTDTNAGGPFPPSYAYTTRLRVYLFDATLGSNNLILLASKDFSERTDTWKTITLSVDTAGYWQAYMFAKGAKQPSRPTLQGQDPRLVTGGALGSGKIGLYDATTGTSSAPRFFDNFVAFNPPTDAVLFASKHLEVRSDRAVRESNSGGSWGKVPRYFGDRFFLPPSGANHRTVRLVWKARRSDVDGGLPDTTAPGSDSTTLAISATPRYLLPPGANG